MTFVTFALLVILLSSCNESLNPEMKQEGKASFSGTIYFQGGVEAWPDTTEMYGIRVGAFKTDNPSSLIGDVIEGNAYFTFSSLGSYADSLNYQISIDETPVDLQYIVVAWQHDTIITSQKVAAVYGGDNVETIQLSPGDSLVGIDFTVDWDNLPPQPF